MKQIVIINETYHFCQLHTEFLSNILLSRLTLHAEEITGDHQCGFWHNRSTTAHIFCIRQIFDKKWEYNEVVHQLFVDVKKTYDSVRREVLYNILIEFSIPLELLRWIKMCLTETYIRLQVGKHLSDTFTFTGPCVIIIIIYKTNFNTQIHQLIKTIKPYIVCIGFVLINRCICVLKLVLQIIICLIDFLRFEGTWCLLPLLFHFCFRICHEEGSSKAGGLEIKWYTQLLFYADYVNILGKSIHTVRKTQKPY
jgi:hypothetical protein